MPLIRLCIDPNEQTEQKFELEATVVTVGTADDNDICIADPSLSPHHFKIELRQDGWHVVDLRSKQGLFVNGEKVQDAKLDRGSLFQAGDKHFLFDVSETEEAEVVEANLPAIGRRTTDLVITDADRCWRCQQPVTPGTMFCPTCGADQRMKYAPSPFVSPVETPHAPGAGMMPVVALILSILGPLALGVGWLAGIVLGLVSLSIIRKRGAHLSDLRKAYAAIFVGAAWFVVLALVIGWWWWSTGTERRIASNERAATRELREIAIAETYAFLTRAFDRNDNGMPEYVSLADLVSNNYGVVSDSLAASPVLHGYRFEMLRADEEEFICVAQPASPGISGIQAFMVRSDGFICGETLKPGTPVTATLSLKRMRGTSAIDDVAEQLVRDTHRVAEQAFRAGQYERAQAIVDAARQRFPTVAGVDKLEGIAKQTMPFLVEIYAGALLAEASNHVASGDLVLAREKLVAITNRYRSFSRFGVAQDTLRAISDRLAQYNEQAAQSQLDVGISNDLRLAFNEAEAAYRTVVNQYPGTVAAKEAERRLGTLAERRSDQSASALVAEALSMDMDSDYQAVLSRIEQLRRMFGSSVAFSNVADRLNVRERQAKARVFAAAARDAYAKTNISAALTAYVSATDLDPALARGAITNYAAALLYGVSNALAVTDFRQALRYADTYQALKFEPEKLTIDAIDQIRCEIATLDAQKGEYESAKRLLEACGDRLNTNAAMTFLAGKVYAQCGEPDKAARAFLLCYTQHPYTAEATILLAENAAAAALQTERRLVELIELDDEWMQLVRTFGISLPAITNSGGTSLWQNLTVQLCDHVEMTYELLTYSGSETDLFLEKERERNELNAEMRRLQQILRASLRQRRAAVIAARDLNAWWSLTLATMTNSMTNVTGGAPVPAVLSQVTLKQRLAEIAAQLFERAVLADMANKEDLLSFLNTLVARLESKQPLRNVLSDVKKYLQEQRTQQYSRDALGATAEAVAAAIDPAAIAKVLKAQ